MFGTNLSYEERHAKKEAERITNSSVVMLWGFRKNTWPMPKKLKSKIESQIEKAILEGQDQKQIFRFYSQLIPHQVNHERIYDLKKTCPVCQKSYRVHLIFNLTNEAKTIRPENCPFCRKRKPTDSQPS